MNIAASRKRARSEPGWRVVGLATGHDPMISAPHEFSPDLARLRTVTSARK